eukprot:1263796-Amphidinium_carterae.1
MGDLDVCTREVEGSLSTRGRTHQHPQKEFHPPYPPPPATYSPNIYYDRIPKNITILQKMSFKFNLKL